MRHNLDSICLLRDECCASLSKIKSSDSLEFQPLTMASAYCDFITKHPISQREKLVSFEQNIDSTFGDEIRILFYQYLIYHLYIDGISIIDNQDLPSSIIPLLEEDFSRIVNFAQQENKKLLSIKNQAFLSYIEKLLFRAYPIGNQDVSISGIPRSIVFRQGLLKGFRCFQLLYQSGGNYPFFEMHYNPHRLRYFNQQGWNDLLFRATELLAKQTHINGIFGSAWFFDKTLADISPEIFYIYQTLEKIGGEFFFFKSSEDDQKNAFLTSKARREAYNEGRYIPASYMVILPRDVLLSHYDLD